MTHWADLIHSVELAIHESMLSSMLSHMAEGEDHEGEMFRKIGRVYDHALIDAQQMVNPWMGVY